MVGNRIVKIFEPYRMLSQRNMLTLLLLIIGSTSILIVINHLTIKTLSAVRAYTHGESQYSKGQKDAARHLVMFMHTEDIAHWKQFETEIQVSVGDSLARVAMLIDSPDEVVKKGLQAGRNHPDDQDNMIWLFKNFKDISFMRDAIQLWKEADVLVGKEYRMGQEIYQRVIAKNIGEEEKPILERRINEISSALTHKERLFTNTLGAASRSINQYLFFTNLALTIVIILTVIIHANRMIRQAQRSQLELELKNEDLTNTNQQLDHFVYSASHDLRAPITSLKGLIQIARLEKDASQLTEYFDMMQYSLSKQDQFINDIIQFSKNKRMGVVLEPVNLAKAIDDSLQQHMFMDGSSKISIYKSYEAEHAFTDPLRLNIVINNLISNAFKYSDESKEAPFIRVTTKEKGEHISISVEDNGVGISQEDQQHIFEMFFVTQNNNKGSGLGLYIVKNAMEKLRGSISVESEKGKGSTFHVSIPKK